MGNGRPRSAADASMRSGDPGTVPVKAGISVGEVGPRGGAEPSRDGAVATSAAAHGTHEAAVGTYADAHGSGTNIYVRQAMQTACPCSAAGTRR